METNDRQVLYAALSLIEDALADGYRSGLPVPEFAEQAPIDAAGAAGAAGSLPHAAAPQRAGTTRSTTIPKNDSLTAIATEASRCMACRLASGRTRSVPGQGSARPLVMVIGEAPGAEEDTTGLPFVGPAGQLLDKMLGSIGLSRQENCFLGNIVKCRPSMNRDPAPDEQAACIGFLDRQIALLRPKAFLAVGRIPAQSLLGVKDGIGKLRGTVYEYLGVPLIATYHPAALLRDEALKRPSWEDLKLLKSVLDGQGRQER